MSNGFFRRLLVAGAAVLATGLASVPARAASPPSPPSLGHGPWKPTAASVHLMRPAGSTAGPSAGAPSGQRVMPDAPAGNGQLTYHFGPIQDSPKLFVDFWGSDFNADTDAAGFTGSQGANYLTAFLNEIAGSAWLSSPMQYCEADRVAMPPNATITSCGGNTHAGVPVVPVQTWNDGNAVAITHPNLTQIDAEADAARTHFLIPAGDFNSTVIVVSPPGKSTFSDPSIGPGSFCAFHFFTTTTVFAYQPWSPDAGTGCHTNEVNATNDTFGHGHFDGLSISSGHEVAEVITDPLPGVLDQVGNTTFGWIDAAGFENGDKCSRLHIWPERDITFATDFFAVQPLYSDEGATCALEEVGGLTNAHAAIAAQDAAHRDVFVRALDNSLWTRSSAGGPWSAWTALGGVLLAGPAAVSRGSGFLDVFVRGGDSALWHRPWNSTTGWGAWESLGGLIYSTPAAASWASNRLDVVAVGHDGGLWHRAWDGTSWQAWEPLGGVVTADPSAVSFTTNRVDVFVRGGDFALWHRSFNGTSWAAWEPLGGLLGSGTSAASTGTNLLQVFVLATDGSIWRDNFDGSTWSWSGLGGTWPMDPAAISPPAASGTRFIEFFNPGSNGSTERLVLGQ
ncbi:MAG TPA: hypothetical protein VE953_15525 [Terriglobales bacterium]|nr:hypothetical protein [Terriglobales bacterium]